MSVSDIPPEKRLYTFDEIVRMLDGWTSDWHEDMSESNEDAVRGWVEHMDVGEDTAVGRAP